MFDIKIDSFILVASFAKTEEKKDTKKKRKMSDSKKMVQEDKRKEQDDKKKEEIDVKKEVNLLREQMTRIEKLLTYNEQPIGAAINVLEKKIFDQRQEILEQRQTINRIEAVLTTNDRPPSPDYEARHPDEIYRWAPVFRNKACLYRNMDARLANVPPPRNIPTAISCMQRSLNSLEAGIEGCHDDIHKVKESVAKIRDENKRKRKNPPKTPKADDLNDR